MGPYKPLRTWVDEFIPYYMEIMGVDQPWHTWKLFLKASPKLQFTNELASQRQLVNRYKIERKNIYYIDTR